MNKKEIKKVDYSCNILGETVHITLEYFHLGTGYTELVGFHCDGCYNCGVGKETSQGTWTFDWSKCVHPFKS